MTQEEARAEAKRLSDQTGDPYIATTTCALRGEYEQGPDANNWVVLRWIS